MSSVIYLVQMAWKPYLLNFILQLETLQSNLLKQALGIERWRSSGLAREQKELGVILLHFDSVYVLLSHQHRIQVIISYHHPLHQAPASTCYFSWYVLCEMHRLQKGKTNCGTIDVSNARAAKSKTSCFIIDSLTSLIMHENFVKL